MEKSPEKIIHLLSVWTVEVAHSYQKKISTNSKMLSKILSKFKVANHPKNIAKSNKRQPYSYIFMIKVKPSSKYVFLYNHKWNTFISILFTFQSKAICHNFRTGLTKGFSSFLSYFNSLLPDAVFSLNTAPLYF